MNNDEPQSCNLPPMQEGLGTLGKRWGASGKYAVERWRGDDRQQLEDDVIEEAPVGLFYNSQAHVVMLATPQELDDFALGFSLTEGIIQSPDELILIDEFHREAGIELWLKIPPERFAKLGDKERNLTGRTGCGLCGAASISQALHHPDSVTSGPVVSVEVLRQALADLNQRQTLNNLTGAVHGAAWVDVQAGILLVREDVGRHNALDKLIGAMVKGQINPASGFVIVTSRASFEMVQKCANAGISLMAAISAPTGLAIRLAQQMGFTLLGFARGDRHVVYTHPQRLQP